MTHAIMEDLKVLDEFEKADARHNKRLEKIMDERRRKAESDRLAREWERLGAKEIKV